MYVSTYLFKYWRRNFKANQYVSKYYSTYLEIGDKTTTKYFLIANSVPTVNRYVALNTLETTYSHQYQQRFHLNF
jgi:hypothetical protein